MINKETAMQRMADWKNPDFNVPEEELSDALFWLAKERVEAFMKSLTFIGLQDKAMVSDEVKHIVEEINHERFDGAVSADETRRIRSSLFRRLHRDYMVAKGNEEKKKERIRQTARLKEKGYDIKTIADVLDVGENTVRSYLKLIENGYQMF